MERVRSWFLASKPFHGSRLGGRCDRHVGAVVGYLAPFGSLAGGPLFLVRLFRGGRRSLTPLAALDGGGLHLTGGRRRVGGALAGVFRDLLTSAGHAGAETIRRHCGGGEKEKWGGCGE